MSDRSNDMARIDPAWLRGLTQPRLSRRRFLRYAGVGAGAVGLSSILAACGVEEEAGPKGPAGEGSPEWWAGLKEQGPAGQVNFTNWPAYIDIKTVQGERTRPTLDLFKKATGIEVTYRADINANEDFYAAIRPALEAGQDTGHDIIVITNGKTLSEIFQLGYLIELDHSLLPTFDANVSDVHRDPPYDPGNKYTIAWQSGFNGLAWNTKYVDEPVTSFMDLFNEKYAGHVGAWGLPEDIAGMAMLALGIAPETSTPDDWQKAADLLIRLGDSGVLRRWYDQDYLTAIENEDLWITTAWSGDILNDKLYFPEFATFEFVVPEEGAIIWTDNMCIPTNAAHPLDAIMLMDWYYKPDIAARLTEWNAYVSPVPAGGEIVQADAEAARGANAEVLQTIADSPYVFPTPEIQQISHTYRVLEGDEIEQWDDLFLPIFLA
ncbi:MAG: ABC transporter substrate-binding protein [Actinomycetota bacterium]